MIKLKSATLLAKGGWNIERQPLYKLGDCVKIQHMETVYAGNEPPYYLESQVTEWTGYITQITVGRGKATGYITYSYMVSETEGPFAYCRWVDEKDIVKENP